MKPDEISLLIRDYRMTPRWRWMKRLRLSREINWKWHKFIEEVCDASSDSG